MDDIDFDPRALFERYDARVRYVASRRQFRHVEFETLVQAGHLGVLECRRRYCESDEPPLRTPFDRTVWYYIKSAIERAAQEQRPSKRRRRPPANSSADEALSLTDEVSATHLEDYHSSPAGHDFLARMVDILDQKQSGTLFEVLAEPDEFMSPDPSPEEYAELRRAREQLAQAIGFLPRNEHIVAEAVVLEGRSIAEVAAELRLHERTVRQTLANAQRQLKHTLADRASEQRRVR